MHYTSSFVLLYGSYVLSAAETAVNKVAKLPTMWHLQSGGAGDSSSSRGGPHFLPLLSRPKICRKKVFSSVFSLAFFPSAPSLYNPETYAEVPVNIQI